MAWTRFHVTRTRCWPGSNNNNKKPSQQPCPMRATLFINIAQLCIFSLEAVSAGALSNVLVQLKPFDNVRSFLQDHPRLTPSINHNFSFASFQGFSGKFSKDQMYELVHDMRVSFVSKDDRVQASALQIDAPRHLARLAQREKLPPFFEPGTKQLVYPHVTDGQDDIDVYVIDSGIAVDHPEFNGRAHHGIDLTNDADARDTNGHGTHVAGIIGAQTYGVAKGVKLISVKVLTADGSGSLADVIAGINFAVDSYDKRKESRKGIANLSFGTGYNSVLNAAVDAAVSVGLPVVVAAGNSNRPACITSPGSSSRVITVGAIDDETDSIASFSNWGSCVDLFASGVQVRSASHLGNDTALMSGTSMAAPAVTGLLAMIMGQGNNYTEALDQLMRVALEGAIDDVSLKTRPKSPNRLAMSPLN